MLNEHVFIGRVAETPILKRTAQGTLTTKSIVLCKRNYKTDEESEYTSDSFLVVIYGKKAEKFVNMTVKDSLVSFVSSVKTRRYMTDTNQLIICQEDIIREFEVLESKSQVAARKEKIKIAKVKL